MDCFRLKSFPEIAFAHVFGAERYHATIPAGRKCLEISYISKGSLPFTSNGVSQTAQTGDILCNLSQHALILDCDEFHEHHTIGFSADMECCEPEDPDALSLPLLLRADQHTHVVHHLIDEGIRTHTLHPENRLILTGLLLQLLGECNALHRRLPGSVPYSFQNYVHRAKNYIYQNLSRPIRQQDIAEHLGITPQYLCNIFRKTEGIPLMRFLNRVKLERVRSLLENEHLTLRQASELCGYNDPNYVSRLFKQMFRENPTDFKKSPLPVSSLQNENHS